MQSNRELKLNGFLYFNNHIHLIKKIQVNVKLCTIDKAHYQYDLLIDTKILLDFVFDLSFNFFNLIYFACACVIYRIMDNIFEN